MLLWKRNYIMCENKNFLIGTKNDIYEYKKNKNNNKNISFTNIKELKRVSRLFKNGVKDYSTNLFRGISFNESDTIVLINLSEDDEKYIKNLLEIFQYCNGLTSNPKIINVSI